ncbi:MAG: hypothetical protein RL701_2230 [Pseudomonadota bacterium]|jgi:hypothetical protein
MDDDDSNKRTSTSPARRPYVAPRVEESATFEHLVLTCTFSSNNCKLGGGKKFSS